MTEPSLQPAESTEPTPSEVRSQPVGGGGQLVRRVLLPLAVLAMGGVAGALVLKAKPEAERKPPEQTARLVTAAPLVKKPLRAIIKTRGLVAAEREVTLIPEVTGKVIYVSDSLVAGGKVKKGELLLRIDGRTYEHQVTQQLGQLKSAEHQVEVEKSQREIAEYESKVLADVGHRSPVATRESHLNAAKSALDAQRGAVDNAKLNLARTVIRAPFDATVVTDDVDVGQVVGLSSQLARLVATDVLRIEVSVPLEDLEMIDLPTDEAPGSEVVVRQTLHRGKTIERKGEVSHLVRELDDKTRRARVLVTVPDPFNQELGLPLLPGARVEVEIQGRALPPLTAIPRSAVYGGDTAWVVGPDSKLAPRKLEIAWADRDQVYVDNDFASDQRLVTTVLSTPLEGLTVRVQAEETPNKDAAPAEVHSSHSEAQSGQGTP